MVDTYVDVTTADAYHSARPSHEVWMSLDPDQKNRALVAASDYLDVNYPLKDGLNERMRDGEAIPTAVTKAICELALNAGELTADKEADKASVKVGEVSVTYRELNGLDAQRFSYVSKLLGNLLARKHQGARMVRG